MSCDSVKKVPYAAVYWISALFFNYPADEFCKSSTRTFKYIANILQIEVLMLSIGISRECELNWMLRENARAEEYSVRFGIKSALMTNWYSLCWENCIWQHVLMEWLSDFWVDTVSNSTSQSPSCSDQGCQSCVRCFWTSAINSFLQRGSQPFLLIDCNLLSFDLDDESFHDCDTYDNDDNK